MQSSLAVTLAISLNGLLTNSLKLTVGQLIDCSVHSRDFDVIFAKFLFSNLQVDLVPISWNAVFQMVLSTTTCCAQAIREILSKVAEVFPVDIHHVSHN